MICAFYYFVHSKQIMERTSKYVCAKPAHRFMCTAMKFFRIEQVGVAVCLVRIQVRTPSNLTKGFCAFILSINKMIGRYVH
jgi:hypothetical protein